MSDDPNKSTLGDLDGKTLGQYHIEHQIGQGGMATVYLAKQASIGRTVAIKVMPMYFMHDPNFLARFKREVEVIARLQHPRILPVYDYGEVDGRPYIVMAFLPGGTLAERIQEGAMPLPEVAKLVEQIAEGLDYAHKDGIIHRDFKPSNVLLDKAGNAHLADFGIAKISESTSALTGSGVVGTPSYMAPEMASSGEVTPAADIYALGVTLYQMLTGRYPFSGDTPLRVMMAHAVEPVPDVRLMRPELSPAIADIVTRAMAKDPLDRYPTAGELATDLRAAIEGRGIQQPRPSEPTMIEAPLDTAPMPQAQRTPSPAAPPPPPTPTPQAAWTPAMPSPQRPPTPEPASYPAAGVEPKKRGGCSPVMVIGAILVLAVVACVGFFVLLGGAAILSPTSPTLPPPPTNIPATAIVLPTRQPTTEAIVPTDPPPPTASAGNADILIVVNNADTSIWYVYITPAGDDWGNDELAVDEVIVSGSDFTFTDIPEGLYDIKTEDSEHNVISWNFGQELGYEAITLTVSGSPDQLTVINSTSDDLCSVTITETGSATWRNLISTDYPIPSGEQRKFPVDDRQWDLTAETCDGRLAERPNEPLGGENEWTITD